MAVAAATIALCLLALDTAHPAAAGEPALSASEIIERSIAAGGGLRRFARIRGVTIDGVTGASAIPWLDLYTRYAWEGLSETWIDVDEPVIDGANSYHVVRFTPRERPEIRLYIDSNSWLPASTVRTVGGAVELQRYTAFENVQGIAFPMVTMTTIDGDESVRRFTDVDFSFDRADLSLERHLDAILTASIAEKRIPGMVAIVNRGDETIFHKAYGVENVELNVPADMDSIFPLASVSKVFAGTIAMILVEQGKLDLDVSIREYLPDVPETHAAITTRHLLNHSHGLVDALSDNPGRGMPMSAAEKGTPQGRLDFTFSRPPKFASGSGWAYSVTGYEVLQKILEFTSDLDYESLFKKEIFGPFGMESAAFGGSDRLVPGRAAMDYVWVNGKLEFNYLNYPPEIFTGAGLNASASDVMKFYRGLVSGKLLSPERRDEMWREVVLSNGEPTYYGLGWGSFRTTRDRRWSVGHSGGGSSWTRYFPETDVTVVVLSNLNGAREDKLVYDLATAVEQNPLLNPD